MKKAKIEWQTEVELPWWVQIRGESKGRAYLAKKRPYTITEGEWVLVQIHCVPEDLTKGIWQGNLEDLLWELENMGVGVMIAPENMILPRTRIQRVDGKKLRGLFAFSLAKKYLKKCGISLGEAQYLIAGEQDLELVLAGLGQDVNYLSFWGVGENVGLEDEILAECGLKIPHIHGGKNPLLAEVDVVLWCGMEGAKWAYLLPEHAIFIDVFGGFLEMDFLKRTRADVLCISPEKGIWEKKKMPLAQWEAVVYQNITGVKKLWNRNVTWAEMAEIYKEVEGYLCGISSI